MKTLERIEKLQAQIDELRAEVKKEEFKPNKWVKIIGYDTGEIRKIAQIKEISNDILKLKGRECFIPATHEEIYNHLLTKAKNDGFEVGVEVEKPSGIKFKINEFVLITEDNKNISVAVRDYFIENGIHLAIRSLTRNAPLNKCKLIKKQNLFEELTKSELTAVLKLIDICKKHNLSFTIDSDGLIIEDENDERSFFPIDYLTYLIK